MRQLLRVVRIAVLGTLAAVTTVTTMVLLTASLIKARSTIASPTIAIARGSLDAAALRAMRSVGTPFTSNVATAGPNRAT